jgi:hypothetical protein
MVEDENGDYILYDDMKELIDEIFYCWKGIIQLKDMSAYDIVESIENVVQQLNESKL